MKIFQNFICQQVVAWHRNVVLVVLLLVAGVLQAQNIHIGTGTFLVNNKTLVLQNTGIKNNGTLRNATGSKVVFRGDKSVYLSGSGSISFYGLEVDKTSIALKLQQSISVAGPLELTRGELLLNDFMVELKYPNGLIQNETEQNRILTAGTGEVFITQSLNAPSAVNPGNLGVHITTTKDLGLTTIRRGHQIQYNNNTPSVKRYYKIEPTLNTNLNARLRFGYLDAEKNNLLESSLVVWQKKTSWQVMGKSAADGSANYVEKSDIGSFGLFTLGSVETSSLQASVFRPIPISKLQALQIAIGPNPTVGHVIMRLRATTPQKIQLHLMNAEGRLIQQTDWHVSVGSQTKTLTLQNYPAGVYLLDVRQGESAYQLFRIVKQ